MKKMSTRHIESAKRIRTKRKDGQRIRNTRKRWSKVQKDSGVKRPKRLPAIASAKMNSEKDPFANQYEQLGEVKLKLDRRTESKRIPVPK